jgi:signal transduction histidine kinase
MIRPLGLRTRITLSFALGALALSAVLSLLAWNLTRENLLGQREESSVSRAITNALVVRRGLPSTGADTNELLASLPTPDGAQLALYYEGSWSARNPVEFGQGNVPESLRGRVGGGEAALMRTEVRQKPYIMVGVPLPVGDGAFGSNEYFEAVPLSDITQTLRGLAVSLLGASAITTLAGGMTGFLVSRRLLVPLRKVGAAAEAIAGGRLDTRLARGEDTDLDPLVSSFNDMAAALEERIERDTRFASEVSHELRSPLMTMAAAVEVLENSSGDMSERARTALALLRADTDRFRQLVEDLLEISRVDVGAVVLELTPVPVTEAVIAAVSTSVHGPVPVHYDEALTDIIVAIDKVRFFRAVDNLLTNAANYANGATGVTVTLHHPPPDGDGATTEGPEGSSVVLHPVPGLFDTVRIAIEDSGPGVPPSEREVIFDRFSRGREGGNRGADSGTGLGLALVDEHIRLHGGRVWVEDRPSGGSGARFVIELPAIPLPPADSDTGDGAAGFTYGLDSAPGSKLDSDMDADADADDRVDSGPDGTGQPGTPVGHPSGVVVGALDATAITGSSPAPRRRWWVWRGAPTGSTGT